MTKFGKIFCNLVANFKGVQLQGVQLSPLGFAACQSKKCTNKANRANYRRVWHSCHTHADTKLSSHRNHRSFWRKIFSHRTHGTHRNDWRKVFSHRLHGCAQIRRAH